MRAVDLLFAGCGVLAACGGDDSKQGAFSHEGSTVSGVPFELKDGIVFTKVRVNGGAERNFVVDTGAQYVFLSVALADELGFKSALFPAPIETLSIGELTVHNAGALRYDLSSFSDAIGMPIDGFLGASLFEHFTMVFDYHEQRLWFLDEMDEHNSGLAARPGISPDMVEAPLDVNLGFALVDAQIEAGTTARLIFDTGAAATVLNRTAYDKLMNQGRPTIDGIMTVGQTGTFDTVLTRFCGFSVGEAHLDEIIADVVPDSLIGQLSVLDADLVGLLGYTFVREFFTVIDYRAHALRLYRFTDRSHIPANELTGVGIVLRQSQGMVVIDRVLPGTDAEQQGLETGDVILSIGGVDVAALYGLPALGEPQEDARPRRPTARGRRCCRPWPWTPRGADRHRRR